MLFLYYSIHFSYPGCFQQCLLFNTVLTNMKNNETQLQLWILYALLCHGIQDSSSNVFRFVLGFVYTYCLHKIHIICLTLFVWYISTTPSKWILLAISDSPFACQYIYILYFTIVIHIMKLVFILFIWDKYANTPIQWLLVFCLLSFLGHQQSWYQLCGKKSLSWDKLSSIFAVSGSTNYR